MRQLTIRPAWFIPILAALMAVRSAPAAQRITLDPPGPREFVLDRANLLSPDEESQIRRICEKLLTEKATPIIIVTIDRMADHGGEGLRIETFATLLFDQWQIGQAKINGADWNTGILLLVSRMDRQARIELGAGWRRDQDAQCKRIMEEQIIPRFKQDDYAGGILAGVDALDKMARGMDLPKVSRPASHYLLVAGFVALAVFTVVSLIRRGSGGWAWLLWGAVFAALGYFLYSALTSRRSSSGGFGGSSFGGGFSGGGGASGSW